MSQMRLPIPPYSPKTTEGLEPSILHVSSKSNPKLKNGINQKGFIVFSDDNMYAFLVIPFVYWWGMLFHCNFRS